MSRPHLTPFDNKLFAVKRGHLLLLTNNLVARLSLARLWRNKTVETFETIERVAQYDAVG